MACWNWGAYLGPEAFRKVLKSASAPGPASHQKHTSRHVQGCANYMNSQLIRMEAGFNGYAEGIALDTECHVSEGSGMNVFLVHDGVLYTPPLATSFWPGITRDAVRSSRKTEHPGKGIRHPSRMLYIADEVFFADRRENHSHPLVDHPSRQRRCRPITRKLQEESRRPPAEASPIATTGSRR